MRRGVCVHVRAFVCVFKCVWMETNHGFLLGGCPHLSYDTPYVGKQGPVQRGSLPRRPTRAQPGSMCLVCGFLFLSMTQSGIFQFWVTQARCRASRAHSRAWNTLSTRWSMRLLGTWKFSGHGSKMAALSNGHRYQNPLLLNSVLQLSTNTKPVTVPLPLGKIRV